jgi:TolB protein
VHPQASELGQIANQTPREVDQSAVFRPTTANAETMEPTTQNISRVTYAEEGADFDPCVSRDGMHLVFASTAHRSTADIYVKRIDSRVVTQLTNDPSHDMMPRFSPDGQSIAFASDRSGNWDIYVMPVTGGRPVQVTFDAADEIAPSWSPDGTQLCYSRMGEMSGRWEMWIASVEKPEIANYIGYGLFPQWCPIAGTGKDGADRILFQLGRERGRRTFAVWTIEVTEGQASNATEIRSSSTNALVTPSWSPDGEWVVMSEVPLEVGDEQSDPLNDVGQPKLKATPDVSSIWLVSVDNEAPVRLTFSNRLALSPVWSKSNRLYFVSNSAGVENIWSMDMQRPLATARAMLPNRMGSDAYAQQPEPQVEASSSDEATELATEGEDHR